jgi:acetyltransferase-like isoleucine patch superfamily enzyme
VVHIDTAHIKDTRISIQGTGNQLIIDGNVRLHGSIINVRGNNCTVHIGEKSAFNGARLVNVGKDNTIAIGKNCLFADHIEVWASDTHAIYDTDKQRLNPEKPVIIQDHVWICSHAKILKGVTIGQGAVVGMNTLITNDIPPETLVVGNPPRVVRENISWDLEV